MVGLLTIAGGALVTGLGMYKYYTSKPAISVLKSAPRGSWLTHLQLPHLRQPTPIAQHTAARTPAQPVATAQEREVVIRSGLRTSTLALGIASTGLFFFAPLQYASVPVLIYMGVPSAQNAYDKIVHGHLSIALAETAVLALCLGSGYYWVGSLGFWLYYLGRLYVHNQQLANQTGLDGWPLPTMARCLKDDIAHFVPTATLQRGEQVIVQTSEMVPVDGIIVDGVAWLRRRLVNENPCQIKQVGDRVFATDIVMAGRIAIQVKKRV